MMELRRSRLIEADPYTAWLDEREKLMAEVEQARRERDEMVDFADQTHAKMLRAEKDAESATTEAANILALLASVEPFVTRMRTVGPKQLPDIRAEADQLAQLINARMSDFSLISALVTVARAAVACLKNPSQWAARLHVAVDGLPEEFKRAAVSSGAPAKQKSIIERINPKPEFAPKARYVGLMKDDGTEVSGSGYGRIRITETGKNYSFQSGGDWGYVAGVGKFEQQEGGQPIVTDSFLMGNYVGSGDTITFRLGDFFEQD